jgi:hypothetical protein
VRADTSFETLPGSDLVRQGLLDLAEGRDSIEAMLVACAPERLREVGVSVPPITLRDPEHRLYELVERQVGSGGAHGRYNALRRRLVSFLDSARLDASAGRR